MSKLPGTLLNISLSFFLALLCCSSKSSKEKNFPSGKKSRLAGSWYPSDERSLGRMIDGFIDAVPTEEIKGNPLGFIVPHAGYFYSGKTAAYTYKMIGKYADRRDVKINRVVILAPSHYGYLKGFSTPSYAFYETPFGKVELDGETLKALRRSKLHVESAQLHDPEHSIEIQLPFLQRALKPKDGFKVVPALIGSLDDGDFDKLADLFAGLVDENTIFIVSSDFTHCGPRFGYQPFKFKRKPTKDEYSAALKDLDKGAIDEILKLNFEGFRTYVKQTKITICGEQPIALWLKIMAKRKNVGVELLKYDTSISASGDYSNTVSYVSAVFYQKTDGSKNIRKEGKRMNKENKYTLSKKEMDTLLKMSRDTLQVYLKDGKYPLDKDYEITDNLKVKRGVFVTLHKKGALRGCIGYIEGIKPLYRAVMENTTNAALQDPRFPAVKLEEVKDIDIEISVMTPLSIFSKPDEIEIGTDGIVISKGWYRGLLLPQVATEYNWNRKEFLEHVSLKAGLDRNAWKEDGVKLEKFSAIVFGEKEKH